MLHREILCDVGTHAVPYELQRQVRVLPPQVPMHLDSVVREQIPAIVVREMPQPVGKAAVATMVVAANDKISRGCGRGKFGIAARVFAEAVQDVNDLRCRARRVPGMDANRMAVRCVQKYVCWLSHAASSKSVATCRIHLILINRAV